ncbi:hypothetical protein EYD10_04976 [Varanus komodoensis]|nr:hypothetical protein EYD10_04976 [Varanus komodoensis]
MPDELPAISAVLLGLVNLGISVEHLAVPLHFLFEVLDETSSLKYSLLGERGPVPPSDSTYDLDRNNITRITKVDFAGLKNLRVLHLEENLITVIERGAFQDLKQLERLRLNRNKLQVLPELLFQNTLKLTRL